MFQSFFQCLYFKTFVDVIYFRPKEDLPVYTSDNEDEVDVCSLCKESIDDPINYGKFINIGKYRVHYLCCVSIFCAIKILCAFDYVCALSKSVIISDDSFHTVKKVHDYLWTCNFNSISRKNAPIAKYNILFRSVQSRNIFLCGS